MPSCACGTSICSCAKNHTLNSAATAINTAPSTRMLPNWSVGTRRARPSAAHTPLSASKRPVPLRMGCRTKTVPASTPPKMPPALSTACTRPREASLFCKVCTTSTGTPTVRAGTSSRFTAAMAAASRSTAACPVRNRALSRRSVHRERTESFVSRGTSCGMRRQSSIPAESAKQPPQSASRPRMPRCSSRTAPSRGPRSSSTVSTS